MFDRLKSLLPLFEHVAEVHRFVRRLRQWGYLPDGDLPAPGDLEAAIVAFQNRWRLTPSGKADEETLHLMGRRFCGCPDVLPVMEAGALSKWPHLDVTFSSTLKLRQADVDSQFVQIMREVFAEINRHCGLQMRGVSDRGNIMQAGATSRTDRQLDGQGGTLAYAYLPTTRTRATDSLAQIIDLDERWNRKMLFLTVLHETLHNLGIGHNEDSHVALMDPFLRMDIDGLQTWDIAQLQARYGVSTGDIPAPPSPSGAPEVSVAVTFEGRRWEMNQAMRPA